MKYYKKINSINLLMILLMQFCFLESFGQKNGDVKTLTLILTNAGEGGDGFYIFFSNPANKNETYDFSMYAESSDKNYEISTKSKWINARNEIFSTCKGNIDDENRSCRLKGQKYLVSIVYKNNSWIVSSMQKIGSNTTLNNIQEKKVATINDPDGYTNVREAMNTNSKIVAKIYEGERFDTYPSSESNWWLIKTKKGIKGYIHKSRIKIISD